MGRTLADGLRVLEKLGETSYGSHYRAQTADSGIEVDLISLRPDGVESQPHGTTPTLGRLWDQLSRARGIHHPNIAAVRGMGGTSEGLRYVALEVLRGELLSEILNARRVLPLEEAVGLILQAASGLQAAHEAGLLHGSLSPGSILVTRTVGGHPLVKLIRFGLAQNETASGARGKEITNYAAPERLAGHPGDERSDIFSLGAVLHHVLSGEPPGAEPDEAELIPEAARSVISRALEPLPGHRFGTAAAFAQALAAVRNETGDQRDRARGGRRGAVAIGAGLGIVAVAGVWLLQSTERPRPEPVSGRRVTVSGAAPAAQVAESVKSLPAPRETVPTLSPKSGTARHPPPEVSRRESISSDAPRAVREGPSATRESAAAEVREPKVSVPERAEAGGPTPEAAAQPESAPITPESSAAGAGEAAGPADTGLGYAPGVAAEPPAPADPSRLTSTEAMRLALGDVVRLRIVASYEEVEPGLLALVLGSGYRTSPSLKYNLGRLYAAYVDLLDYPEKDPVMELWQNGRKIGQYTRDESLW